MKESELRAVINKPAMDDILNEKIANKLLIYGVEQQNPKNYFFGGLNRSLEMISHKFTYYWSPKLAFLILCVIALGSGTAVAANWTIKSISMKIEIMTEDEFGKIKADSQRVIKEKVKKSFGQGNRMVDVMKDQNREVGNRKRHESDRTNGDEAFAQMGLSNMVPTKLFENFLLRENGFQYTEEVYEDGAIDKEISGTFFADDITRLSSSNKSVVFSFWLQDLKVFPDKVYFIVDKPEDIKLSQYTTKGGIECTFTEQEGLVSVDIVIESSTAGYASILMSFNNFTDRVEIEEILDSIPFTADTVTDKKE